MYGKFFHWGRLGGEVLNLAKVIRLYLDISEGGAGGLVRPWEGRFLVGI